MKFLFLNKLSDINSLDKPDNKGACHLQLGFIEK